MKAEIRPISSSPQGSAGDGLGSPYTPEQGRAARGCRPSPRVAGTHGYLAPEYALYGQLTEKSDVCSFGVLLLEIMSGRNALDKSAESNSVLIIDWASTLVKSERAEEVMDAALVRDGNPKGIMERFVLVGILCAHAMAVIRPTISEALKMLDGDIDVPPIPDRPMPLSNVYPFGDQDGTITTSPASNVPISRPNTCSGD